MQETKNSNVAMGWPLLKNLYLKIEHLSKEKNNIEQYCPAFLACISSSEQQQQHNLSLQTSSQSRVVPLLCQFRLVTLSVWATSKAFIIYSLALEIVKGFPGSGEKVVFAAHHQYVCN